MLTEAWRNGYENESWKSYMEVHSYMRSEISIIMPIGNKIQYLYDTLQSVKNQTFEAFEIICIDDATNDGSSEVLEKIAESDSRFKVIRLEEKQGAGWCRNKGFGLAKAPFVIFLDADDLFEKDLLEHMYKKIKETSADIVLVEYEYFNESIEDTLANAPLYKINHYNNPVSIENLSDYFFIKKWRLHPWDKLYHRNFLLENKIEFQDIEAANDVYFSAMSAILADKIAYVDTTRPLVHYRVNTTSQTSNRRTPMHSYYAFKHVQEELIKRGLWSRYSRKVALLFLNNVLGELQKRINEKKGREGYEFLQKEGLKALGVDQLADYQEIVDQFKTKSFDDKWLAEDVMLKKRLYQQVARMNEVIGFLKKSRCALWGAGAYTRAFLEFIKDVYGSIDLKIIDNNEKKQGSEILGFKIYSPQEIIEDVDLIIITNKYYFPAIYTQVCSYNESKEFFLLYAFLEMDISINDCIIRS